MLFYVLTSCKICNIFQLRANYFGGLLLLNTFFYSCCTLYLMFLEIFPFLNFITKKLILLFFNIHSFLANPNMSVVDAVDMLTSCLFSLTTEEIQLFSYEQKTFFQIAIEIVELIRALLIESKLQFFLTNKMKNVWVEIEEEENYFNSFYDCSLAHWSFFLFCQRK